MRAASTCSNFARACDALRRLRLYAIFLVAPCSVIALLLDGESVWSLAFSLSGATVALASAVAGLVYARRLSLTSKASPLRSDFRWLVVCAVLYFVLAIYSGTVSVQAAQRADLLRNGEDFPGTPDSVFCEGFFMWKNGTVPEPIRLDWLSEKLLDSHTLFGNMLTSMRNLTAVPGCMEIVSRDDYFRVRSQLHALVMKMTTDQKRLIRVSKYERKSILRHMPVPVYRFVSGGDPFIFFSSRPGHTIHLCGPGLYAFQDGWLDYVTVEHKTANPFPVCVDTRATKFLPWYSWMISLIVMGFAFQFLSQIHSMVGKVEVVATVVAECQSRENEVGPADPAQG